MYRSILTAGFVITLTISCFYSPPELNNPADPLSDASIEITEVPLRSITIDGFFSDWDGIDPLITDPNDFPGFPDHDISAVYLAHDNDYIYIRFDLYNDSLTPVTQELAFFDYNTNTDFMINLLPASSLTVFYIFEDVDQPGIVAAEDIEAHSFSQIEGRMGKNQFASHIGNVLSIDAFSYSNTYQDVDHTGEVYIKIAF